MHVTPARTVWRYAARLVLAAALGAVFLLAQSGPAAAHPALIETTPGAGYAVIDPPETVAVTFNEPVTPVGDALTLSFASGARVPLGTTLSQDGRRLEGMPREPLGEASYVVQYRVVALDGDLIEGTFSFGVATPVRAGSTAGGPSQDDPDRVQPLTAGARSLLFTGLALALGGTVGAGLARQAGAAVLRPPTRGGALLGLAGATALLGQVAWGSGLDATLRDSAPAQLLAGEAALFAFAALLARTSRGRPAAAALLGVVALEAVRAHPGEAAAGAGVALTFVHLVAAAVWAGALVHVVRVALRLRRTGVTAWPVIGAYAKVALGLFVLVLGTGTLNALLLLPTLDDWVETTYGQVLLAKLALFAVVVISAVLARRSHRRAVRSAGGALDRSGRPWRLRPPAIVEAAALSAILVLTGVLTSVTPPTLVSQTSLLPAPTGAVLRTAERINQVSVALVASQGRLEARAYAPGDPTAVEYELAVQIAAADGARRDLSLTSCGPACWTAEADWGQGINRVLLEVSATGWKGGRGTVRVPWPPAPAADLLRQVQRAMGAQTEITTTESVTSGFGAAPTTTSARTGQEYLADEPWSDGGVADPVVFNDGPQRVLLFSVPELGYHFRFRLDEDDRVTDARIVTRKHLIERRYEYPVG